MSTAAGESGWVLRAGVSAPGGMDSMELDVGHVFWTCFSIDFS